MWISLAIVFSAVLFLVDKNQAWSTFWKVVRRVAIAAVLFAIVGGSTIYFYQRHEAAKAASADEFEQYKRK